ncbi:MFS transporter [Actinokineospora enzanensis]|uniref:MFS transporter n=1 Tax=Actinokineospora enzanensis TaxID=155975 RepID=UPI000377C471|nr:MFS transporter [Actinokineospora enzanensis]
MGVLTHYRDRGYLRLWLAQALSTVGSLASMVALPLVVLGELHSASAVGLTTFVEAAAAVAVVPAAGLVIDRLGPRPVMVVADLARAAVSGLLVWMVWAHRLGPAALFGTAAVTSALGVVFAAASTAAFRQVVPPDRLTAALSVNQARFAVASIVGPLVGAACYAWSPPLPFLLDTVSFLVSAACVAPLRLARESRPDRIRPGEAVAGWRFLWTAPLPRYLVSAAVVGNFVFGGVVLVLLAVFQDQGRGAQTGVVLAVGALANLAGSALTGPAVRRVPARTLVLGVTVVWAAAVLSLPVALGDVAWVCALIGICGLGGPPAQTVTQTTLLRVTPPALTGRVQLVYQVVPQVVPALGPLVGAFLLDRLPAEVVVLGFGLLLAGFAAFGARPRRCPVNG